MNPVIASPRKRNAVVTRAGLLEAATARFMREGFDGVSLREIAADAGVDVALVARYFGGKDELFAEVLANCPSPDELFEGPLGEFGRRVARKVIFEPQDSKDLTCVLIMLRSSASPRASEVVRKSGEEQFYGPFERYLGGENARVRARLAGAIILGAAIERLISGGDYGLPPDELEAMCERLAATLQTVVDG